MFGKEEGLYFPSGIMGNLASVMSHCWERGSEIVAGDQSHIVIYEQGGISTVGEMCAFKRNNFRKNNIFSSEVFIQERSKIRSTGVLIYLTSSTK